MGQRYEEEGEKGRGGLKMSERGRLAATGLKHIEHIEHIGHIRCATLEHFSIARYLRLRLKKGTLFRL